MPNERLSNFRALLKTGDREALKAECQALFAAGVDHKEIVGAILARASSHSVADPSWLPAVSSISLSGSLVHVALQKPQDKHRVMAFGEKASQFRRIEVPPAVEGTLEELRARFEEASLGNDRWLVERCLLGIKDQFGISVAFELIFECLLQPRFLGVTSGPWWSGVRHLAIACNMDLWQAFGDDAVGELLCHLGSKQCAKIASSPCEDTLEAMSELEAQYQQLDLPFGEGKALDEPAFRTAVSSGDVKNAFGAISQAWRDGVPSEQVELALTIQVVDRLYRGAVKGSANWDNLKRELTAVGVMRRAKLIDEKLAFKVAYHAVWQIVRHGNEELADQVPVLEESPTPDEAQQIGNVINEIRSSNGLGAITQVNNYMISGHDPEQLFRELILWVNENCVGGGYYEGQRGMIDAWYRASEHPERNQIPLALAGWMADYRAQHFKPKK